MLTVIAHFFNEEDLLPFWLTHHTQIFQNGLLIDYGSTDNSNQIIWDLAPHWQVVPSWNKTFEAELVDEEVMYYEKKIDGWKMCLNITEFAICSDLENSLTGEAMRFTGYEIIDNCWTKTAQLNSMPLICQRYHGYREPQRDRLIHRKSDGRYHAGRHWSDYHHNPHLANAILFWYSMSPMVLQTKRKIQISSRVPESESAKGFGKQHHALTPEKIETSWLKKSSKTKNILDDPHVAASVRKCLREIHRPIPIF